MTHSFPTRRSSDLGGCRLRIADLSQDAADRVCAEVIGNGGEARAFHGDVGSEEDVRAMVDAAVSAFGGLQGAVNAAGVPQVGKLLHAVDIGDWDRWDRKLVLSGKHVYVRVVLVGLRIIKK